MQKLMSQIVLGLHQSKTYRDGEQQQTRGCTRWHLLALRLAQKMNSELQLAGQQQLVNRSHQVGSIQVETWCGRWPATYDGP